MTLTPSYGRDYKSKKEVLAAWEAGKDFVINDIMSPDNGRYCNKEDLKGEYVTFRYKKLTQCFIHKV